MARKLGSGTPKGHKRIILLQGIAGCECGWRPPAGSTPSGADVQRGRHLVDVRMDEA